MNRAFASGKGGRARDIRLRCKPSEMESEIVVASFSQHQFGELLIRHHGADLAPKREPTVAIP